MKNFFKTVAIVTIFSVSEKFLGFIYRIYLSRTIGSEGMGLYQVALSVFALLLTVCCSGTPITVSRLMTKHKAENNGKKVFGVISSGLFITLITALPLCLIFVLFNKPLSFLFADSRCKNIFFVVLPGLIFTSLYAVLRGVLWGNKDFLPYSIIELLEEVCMIVCGIVLISNATSIYQGAFSAGVAVTISYIFSFTLAVIVFFLRKNKLTNPIKELKPLLASATPITAMRTASSLANSLVSIILPLRLISAGYTQSQAMNMFGAALGQAIPILYIPTTLIGSFTLVLVPELSENFYKGNFTSLKKDLEKALKFTILISCLFIPPFLVCGKELGVLIFNNAESGTYLSASSFLMVLMSISSITTSMLNSMGLENKTLIYYLISGAFMLACIWFLPYVCGIYSLLIGFTFVFGLTSLLNLILLSKTCKQSIGYKKFLFCAVGFIIPTCILGFLIKSIFLSLLGSLLTTLLCLILTVVFNCLFYLCFNLISLDGFLQKIKIITKRKST
ncbi:MAG: oligosaccharide flippase family protein [Clostridia bacterium]|nr:oligosaccharide flippase family protein [Clostridia bacterium]